MAKEAENKEMFSVRLDPPVIKLLKKKAKAQKLTASWFAEKFIEEGLGIRPKLENEKEPA